MRSLTKSALALSAIMLVSLAPSSQAEQIKQTVEAWSGVKLIYNSQTISGNPPPLTINNTVYVPLRNIMGYLNKDVIWNSSDNSVEIRDRLDQDNLLAKTTISSQEIKIKELENKIKDLENGGVPTNQSVQDELESNLNLRYKGYEGESFSITISGNERIISVKIVVTSSDWNDISSSKQNVLVENITDDILAKYPDAKISGTVTNDFSTL
ncbi:MAG TPA: stalk domain-containing protein, partial [Clostridia bacterium]